MKIMPKLTLSSDHFLKLLTLPIPNVSIYDFLLGK